MAVQVEINKWKIKKNFLDLFYGQGSTTWRLQSNDEITI